MTHFFLTQEIFADEETRNITKKFPIFYIKCLKLNISRDVNLKIIFYFSIT
jgi:hypothetical protein